MVSSLVTKYEMPADTSGAISRRQPLARAVLARDAPGVVDRIKAIASDPLGSASSAISSGASAVADKVLASVQPIIIKGLFVGLGVALLGVGAWRAAGASRAS